MQYKRMHIRVPASGEVILCAKGEVKVEARVINVSAGGLSISAPSHIIDQNEYQIQVITTSHGRIHFSGFPIYQTEKSIGIKITSIEKDHLKTIYQIVESFQLTEDFIQHIDEKDIINDRLVEEAGEDIEITFETKPKKDT